MRYIGALNFLTKTDGSPFVYILRATGVALIGAIALILVFGQFVAASDSSETEPSSWALAVILLGVWPLISTAIIAALLSIAKRLAPTYWHAAAIAAVCFASFLGLWLGPAVGIIYVWPFFIYSVMFLAWQLESNQHAWLVTILAQSSFHIIPLFLN